MYDSNKTYELYYHYMHYYPSNIVIMKMPGNLVQRTLGLLDKDPAIIIGDIKVIDEKNAE